LHLAIEFGDIDVARWLEVLCNRSRSQAAFVAERATRKMTPSRARTKKNVGQVV
jgi:hypothetical protein